MGYISIQINKAKGSADTGASDPTRTHLNRELVEFPDGVTDRTEAISHRIRMAGIRRKITPDQVRAIRIVLSGTHEDLMRVQEEGRLDGWCADNLQWLHRTFGQENTVSAVGRTQKGKEEAGGRQTPIPQEIRHRAPVRR